MERTVYAIKRLASVLPRRVARREDRPRPGASRFRRTPTRSSRPTSTRSSSAPGGRSRPSRRGRLDPRPRVGDARSPIAAVLAALQSTPAPRSSPCPRGRPRRRPTPDAATLARLQRYFTGATSRPTRPRRRGRGKRRLDRSGPALLRREDLHADPAASRTTRRARRASRSRAGPFQKASVENLSSGVRRDFELKGAPVLTLDLSRGPARRRPHARGPARRRDEGRRRRRRHPRPHGRRDHRARARPGRPASAKRSGPTWR